MDQIGKLYQNRAMVLQEEVTRLERLLLELRISRQIPPGEEMDWSRPTPEQRAANQVVGGDATGNPINPNADADDIMSRLGNAALDHPYWTTGIGLIAGYNARKIPGFVGGLISPNRLVGGLIGRENSPEKGGRLSPFPKPKINLQGQEVLGDLKDPRSSINWFDKKAYAKGEAFLIQRGEQAKALADAQAKADEAAKLIKDQAAAAKSYDLTKDLASKSTLRGPPEIITVVAGKPIYGPGPLTPEGQVKVGETQEGIYPYEKPGARASAEMQSGQMRRTAVTDLSSEAREATRGVRLGNGATALELPQMTGREVAGKLADDALGIGSKGLRAVGKVGAAFDPASEAASTLLSRIFQGAGRAIAGGVGLLPAVLDLTASNAHAPTIMPSPEEQAEIMAAIKRYEEDERKRNEDNRALDTFAKNPSGRFTPEPMTQYERDDITNSGSYQPDWSIPIAIDMRRIAAKNGTRRGEYSILKDRPQQ